MTDPQAHTDDARVLWLSRQLEGLSRSPIASWVFEPEAMRILWGNPAALSLWQADSMADLLARDLSKMPAHVLTRTRSAVDRLRAGETVVEQWTLYPRGVPTPIQLHLSTLDLPDGTSAVLSQGVEAELDPFLVRGAEMLRHTNVIMALVDPEGRILVQNPAALALFGDRPDWFEWFTDPAAMRGLSGQAFAGERVYRELWVETTTGRRCLGVELTAVLDPLSGRRMLLAHHTDETDRVTAVAELERTLAVVQEQRGQILALSAPIIDLGDSTITVPIVGPLDAGRSAEILDRLLPAIVERRARRTILDFTGSVTSDPRVGEDIARMLRAIRLLGSMPAISGLHPVLCRHLVDSGLAELDVPAYGTLAQALATSPA